MLKRIAHLLLVAVTASSGISAPFMHVHAHGPEHGASTHGEAVDEHCAHHHAEGVHWHLETAAPDAGGGLAAAARGHRHAAVALSVVAVGTSTACLDASAAPADLPGAVARPVEHGVRTPVDPTTGPDPPPRAVPAARAPPVRS